MIYCFDLDGCLCTLTKDYRKAKPLKKRIKEVNQLYKEGHTILIDTARGSVSGINWTKVTKQQLKKWGLKYHLLRVGVKLHADHYIDDRGQNAEDFFELV